MRPRMKFHRTPRVRLSGSLTAVVDETLSTKPLSLRRRRCYKRGWKPRSYLTRRKEGTELLVSSLIKHSFLVRLRETSRFPCLYILLFFPRSVSLLYSRCSVVTRAPLFARISFCTPCCVMYGNVQTTSTVFIYCITLNVHISFVQNLTNLIRSLILSRLPNTSSPGLNPSLLVIPIDIHTRIFHFYCRRTFTQKTLCLVLFLHIP